MDTIVKPAVMASIKPAHSYNIGKGIKEYEIRRNRPTIETPFKVYIYVSKERKRDARHLYVKDPLVRSEFGNVEWWRQGSDTVLVNEHIPAYAHTDMLAEGKVFAAFICDRIEKFKVFENGSVQNWNYLDLKKCCLTYEQLADYIGAGRTGFAWHISDLVVYDKPKELKEFMMQPCDFAASCGACDHAVWTGDKLDKQFVGCEFEVKRPPQSWFYVEETA